MHVWFIWYSKSGDSIGSLLSTSKRTKDDCLLGGGSVRVDKVNGGIDRGVSRLGKNAIHLDSLFLNEQKTVQTGRAVKHRRSCFQREADRDRRKSGGGGDDDEESRQARRKHFFQRGRPHLRAFATHKLMTWTLLRAGCGLTLLNFRSVLD